MRGVFTALVTPFRRDGSIDEKSLEKLIEQQVRSKIHGLVICGTTGESPTLKKEEKIKLFQTVAGLLKGTTTELIAGTGSNDTADTIEFTRSVAKQGIHKFLIVTPYYNKPSQAGLLAHYRAIADSIDRGEIILYNVPGRTGVGFTSATVTELMSHPRITSLKEATGQVSFASEIISDVSKANRKISLLSGDDATYFPLLCEGAQGVISVASHLIPGPMIQMLEKVEAGKTTEAEILHERYFPIFRDLFIESNPAPLKWVLERMGLCENHFRLPLVPVTVETERKLEKMLSQFRITNGVLE